MRWSFKRAVLREKLGGEERTRILPTRIEQRIEELRKRGWGPLMIQRQLEFERREGIPLHLIRDYVYRRRKNATRQDGV